MDRIMPIDLERVKLRNSFRGYEKGKVDSLLMGAAESLQALLAENALLREQVERQWRDLERTKLEENTLKDALLLAQRAADETRSSAHQHADVILEAARQSAMAERLAIQAELGNMRRDIENLRSERKRFEDDFRLLLARYQRDLAVPMLSVVEGNVSGVGT